jgi:hypothetical protein
MRIFSYLFHPGVLLTAALGTLLQIALAYANANNLAGIADTIASYGLSGQVASGGLVAALTGLFYSLSQHNTGQAATTAAGAAAGGLSGTLGASLSQVLGITPLAAGAAPIINWSLIGAAIASLTGTAGPDTQHIGFGEVFELATIGWVFATTAVGGGIGAWIGRRINRRREKHERAAV